MKITERQLLMLVQVLKDTAHIYINGSYSVDTKRELFNEIINQQSD